MQNIWRSGIALLGVMFITLAGAVSVLAQTPQASESSSISAVSTNAAPTGFKTENAVPVHRSAAPAAAVHKSSSSDDGWQFQVTPYLWLPSSSTTASIGNLTVTDAKEGLASSRRTGGLNFGFEGVFEAHHNKFTILSDFLYADVGTERGTPGPGFSSATTGTKAYILDPEVGYRFNQNPDNGSFVEVLGGIRYWHVAETFNLTAGTLA